LLGKLGLTAKVQCLLSSQQRWRNKEFLPISSWAKCQAKCMLHKTLTSAIFTYGKECRSLSKKVGNHAPNLWKKNIKNDPKPYER
jgi:hypothetical protein